MICINKPNLMPDIDFLKIVNKMKTYKVGSLDIGKKKIIIFQNFIWLSKLDPFTWPSTFNDTIYELLSTSVSSLFIFI